MRIFIYLIFYAFIICDAHAQIDVKHHKLDSIVLSQVGVKELTNHNDGKEVEKYLRSCHLPKGYEYCSAFCSWCLLQAGYNIKPTAWAPAWFVHPYLIYYNGHDVKNKTYPISGDLVGYYYPNQKRIGHVGFILNYPLNGQYYSSIEANYGNPGGVYKVIKPKWMMFALARYWNQ
jgi:hypothetical protein